MEMLRRVSALGAPRTCGSVPAELENRPACWDWLSCHQHGLTPLWRAPPLVGFPTEGLGPAVWQGGETEALARLDKHLERKVRPHF